VIEGLRDLLGSGVELIRFHDRAGVPGPVVAAKLARDFGSLRERAEGTGGSFYDPHQVWQRAFELTAGNGAVRFTGIMNEDADPRQWVGAVSSIFPFFSARCEAAGRFLLPYIADCHNIVADCNMTLGEKIRYLREVEGALRGLGREMTQQEVVRAIKTELAQSISQSYLSQIENGSRPHLTNATRMLLAKFFQVHPGYLVDDPEGYQTELVSDLRGIEDSLDLWLIDGAERFRRDAGLSQALIEIAKHSDTRRCMLLLGAILETPGLAERLFSVLRPETDRGAL
jgi:transcriptional regulator with XRE-family HTH domain